MSDLATGRTETRLTVPCTRDRWCSRSEECRPTPPCHGGYGCVFEIELKTVAVGDGLAGAPQRCRSPRCPRCPETPMAGLGPRIGRRGANLLRISRQGVQRAHLVEHGRIRYWNSNSRWPNCRKPTPRRTTISALYQYCASPTETGPRLLTPSMFPPFHIGAQYPRAGFEPDGTFE